MKTFFLSMTLATSAFAQNFRCVNHMYRTSELELNQYSVRISDDYIKNHEELQEAVRKELGLSSSYVINHVGLSANISDVTCTQNEHFQLSCHGSGKYAALIVEGWISGRGGFKMELNVELPHFEVEAKTTGTSLVTTASARIILNKAPVEVSWNTFFYPRPEGSGSKCDYL